MKPNNNQPLSPNLGCWVARCLTQPTIYDYGEVPSLFGGGKAIVFCDVGVEIG